MEEHLIQTEKEETESNGPTVIVTGLVKATVVQRRVIIVDDRHKDWFAFCKGFR